MRRATIGIMCTLTLSASLGAHAFDSIPDESGFSGFVGFGLGNTTMKSNMVSGITTTDIGNDRIDDLNGSAESESKTSGFLNGAVQYTWADSKTQVFAGNSLENWLRYDFTSELGVRREFAGIGELSVSYLFSGMPTKVWKDPYLTNSDRKDSNRNSKGGQISWDKIMDSHFQIKLATRNIRIDNEKSGDSVTALSPAERKTLSREGDVFYGEMLYKYALGNDHFLIPSVKMIRYDLGGDAMAADEYIFQLGHGWGNEQWQTVTNLVYGRSKHDKMNPIVEFGGKKQEDDIYGASFNVFYSHPFGWKNWRAMGGIAAFRASSNIDFYDTNVASISAGMLYHF